MINKAYRKVGRALKAPVLKFLYKNLMRSNRAGRRPFDFEELKLVHQALLSQNLCCVGGKMVPDLEREFASAYEVPYAVASTSGTAAIHVALGALDLNPGDEVITAPITDLGTVIPILCQNAIPVFADVDHTYNMDPADVERKITPETRAIIVVHLFGNPCDMDSMRDIAQRHHLPLIEDCSQTHRTKYRGRYVGTLGDIGCFSFQQSKHMTTGDGGMTITSNKEYWERMKLFADKGYARKGWGRRAYLFHAPNYRMTELVGAVGLAQLRKVDGVVRKRQELGQYLTELLRNVGGIVPAPVTPGAEHSYWLYPMSLEGVDIHEFAKRMKAEKVPAYASYTGKPIYLCAQSLASKKTYGDSQCPFTCGHVKKTYEYKEGLCPRAEMMLDQLVCIPMDESWTRPEIERAARAIEKCLGQLRPKISNQAEPVTTAVTNPTARITSKKKVRIGLVGCGQMGRWHLNSYKENREVEVVAFADTNHASAQNFAQGTEARAYRSHQEMIERETLHGVSICTIPSTHREIALDFLRAGINVLCEKPLAISGAQAEEMFLVAREKQLLLLPAFKLRFYDEVRKARQLIDEGGLGKISTFRVMLGSSMNMAGTWYAQRPLSGGGVLIDNGSHALDLVRYLFGEIQTISAEASYLQGLEVEDTAKLVVRLQNGVVGTVDLSWSVPISSHAYLEIYAEDGSALLDPEGISYKFKTWKEWKRVTNQTSAKEAFNRQIDHFVAAVKKEGPSVVGNEEGIKSQLAIEAAYESIRQGGNKSVINEI